MKSTIGKIALALLLALVLPTACQDADHDGLKYYWSHADMTGDGNIRHIETKGNTVLYYTHDAGASPKKLYLIFTNVGTRAAPLTGLDIFGNGLANDGELSSEFARKHGIALTGVSEITKFNAELPGIELSAMSENERRRVYSAETANLGDKKNFYVMDGGTITATLRKIVSAGYMTLNVWLGDESSGDSNGTCVNSQKHYCMNQEMIGIFADKFLKSDSTSDDIYDWTVNIFGEPWGAHNFSGLIGSEAARKIDILFYDIENDNSITGGVGGFFWAKDNIKKIHSGTSNERLMFYIDSVMSATPDDGGAWDITDSWPSEMLSTLTHEFQHMIHFYQKQIKGRIDFQESEIWLNEMSSMVAEDLLADKIQVDGPRGVAYDNGASGSENNYNGRLPRYNRYNYEAVSDWRGSLANYSLNYAFGAYLARNYGGAEFFRKIVQSRRADYKAIDEALKESGYDETFHTILSKWGAAVILSDETNAPLKYRYNKGDYFESSLNGITYRLGSINLYKYCFYDGNSWCGPHIFDIAAKPGSYFKTSNTYVEWDEFNGTRSIKLELPNNVKMTVVAKDP